jgi:hypothetical protein
MFSAWQTVFALFAAALLAAFVVGCLTGLRIAERRQRLERELLERENKRIKFAAVVAASREPRNKPRPLRNQHRPDPPEAA